MRNPDDRDGPPSGEGTPHGPRGAGTRRDLVRHGGGKVTREEMDRIIRRAAELQFHAADSPDEITEEDLLRIGREVGLEPAHLRRALGELRAEALSPPLPAGQGWIDRWVGPGRIHLRRVVPGDAADVEERLVAWLREEESLEPLRRKGGQSLWEPAEGFLAQIQRGLKWGGRRYELARAHRVELTVTSLEDGYALVSLSLDLQNLRREQAGGYLGGFGALGGSAGAAAGILLLGLPAVGVVVVAGAAAGAGSLASLPAARGAYQREAERIQVSAEGLLDRLERGELPPPGSRRAR